MCSWVRSWVHITLRAHDHIDFILVSIWQERVTAIIVIIIVVSHDIYARLPFFKVLWRVHVRLMWERWVLIFSKNTIRDNRVINPKQRLRTRLRIDGLVIFIFICLMQVHKLQPIVNSDTVSRFCNDHTPSNKLACWLNILIGAVKAQKVLVLWSVVLSYRLNVLIFILVILLFISIIRVRVIIDVQRRVFSKCFIIFKLLSSAIIFLNLFCKTAFALFLEDSLKWSGPENVHYRVYPDQILNETSDDPNYSAKYKRLWWIFTVSLCWKHADSVD